MQGPTPHVSPIKNWKQLVVVVVLAFVIPIAVIVLLSQYVTDVSVPASEDVLSRIKPVGQVVIESAGGCRRARERARCGSGNAPAAAAASASSASTQAAPAPVNRGRHAASAPAAAKPDGKKVYDTTCTACHTPGVAGAPKFGDKAQWAPHLAHGIDGLYTSALKGKGRDAAEGRQRVAVGRRRKAAVDYMVAAAK
jgi:cytochrome c5